MSIGEVTSYKPIWDAPIDDLIGRWSFKPHRGHKIAEAQLTSLLRSRVFRGLEHSGVHGWVVQKNGLLIGFAAVTQLNWDSEQLGVLAARIEYLIAIGTYTEEYEAKKSLVIQILDYCRSRGIRHLSVRIDACDVSGIHVLENLGFITVDNILTFGLSAHTLSPVDSSIEIRLASAKDADSASELARYAFVYDRFHADPAIEPACADNLHSNWVRNSCLGTAADAVLLGFCSKKLAGFVTCKLQTDTREHLCTYIGTIVLVATHSDFRSMGVARGITAAAVNWFLENGANIIEVGTQLRNVPAARLYQRSGFNLVNTSVSLRALVGEHQ